MSNMFTNYDRGTQACHCPPFRAPEPQKGTKLLTNIKGELLGVQVEQAFPLQLYFHLENVCEVELAELVSGTALFEILTTTHKVLVSKEYSIAEILNLDTADLYIFLGTDEMKTLKKETYNMRVVLKTTDAEFVVFDEKDSYLVVR